MSFSPTEVNAVPSNKEQEYSMRMCRQIARTSYQMQDMRIRIGQRLVAAYKLKLGVVPGVKEDEQNPEVDLAILDNLRKDYLRMTDGLASYVDNTTKLPSVKKFSPQGMISNYFELIMANQYFSTLAQEERSFKLLESILDQIDLYRDFLSKIPGLGPQMASVLLSEIDLTRSKYVSSLWRHAGLDTVKIYAYENEAGKEIRISLEEAEPFISRDDDGNIFYKGIPVREKTVGRDRRDYSMVDRTYIDASGKEAVRRSLSHNPWLKTKLLGVLGPSFLKRSVVFVDNQKMTTEERVMLAKSHGWDKPLTKAADRQEMNQFLAQHGHKVEQRLSKYGKLYYQYRTRYDHTPRFKTSSDAHKHEMAMRKIMQDFLADLYNYGRAILGLPVAPRYAEEKLGIAHGQNSPDLLSPFDMHCRV